MASKTMTTQTMVGLDTLKGQAQWPDLSDVRAWDYTLGGYGRDMVDDIILTLPDNPIMVEIGCFLCASAKRWLSLRDDLTVIGVDPWSDDLIAQCWRYVGRPALTRDYPDRTTQEAFARDVETQGPYATALKNVEPFRSRFIPLRGYSPGALERIRSAGVTTDLVYIDANKKIEDLERSHALWPKARITGDDWHWSRTSGYPMRKIVYAFAEAHGFDVTAAHATWVLEHRSSLLD